MSDVHHTGLRIDLRTGMRTTLAIIPLVVGLLAATAVPAGATAGPAPAPGPLSPAVGSVSTPVPPNPTPATSLQITSTVEQLRRHTCVRWSGPATGEGLHIDGVHVWTFTQTRGGVRVTTEETHTGPQVDADVPTATAILRQGLEGWLSDLKATAEARAHHQPR